MLNRWIEGGLLDTLGEVASGCIAFSPLAQGMLTDRYLDGIPAGLAAWREDTFAVTGAADRAEPRPHPRAQRHRRATAGRAWPSWPWPGCLRDERVTSVLIGASSVAQLEDNVAALDNLDFTAEELAEIDGYAVDGGINLWQQSSDS